MKGVEPLIAAVFIIIISIAGIAIVLESSRPSVSRLQEISLLEEAKKILTQIDNAVRTVGEEGEGSTRVLQLSVSDGNYVIDTDKDAVTFSMDSKSQVVGRGVTQVEGNVRIYGELNQILMNVSYSTINITGGGSFGRGIHNLIIRNDGYDVVNQKQIISISLVSPLIIPVAFMNQYNQFGDPYIAKGGMYSGYASYLNALGEGLTYDVTEAIESPGGIFSYSQSQTKNITGANTTPADNTAYMDNYNYNVTSTLGQIKGNFVNRYNQSQTNVIFGINTTSPDNLNSIDGMTYNVTEFAIQIQSNQSSDREAGTIQKKGAVGAPALTGQKVPNSWEKNANQWVGPSNITLSDNKWANASTQYATEDWYNFGFGIPSGSTIWGIRGVIEYSSSNTTTATANINISNDGGATYKPMTTVSRGSTTDANTTIGSYTSLWGLTWKSNQINDTAGNGLMLKSNKTTTASGTIRFDTFTLEVNYSVPTTDSNTTYTTYNNVLSGNYLIITNISVTVNVSSYNSTGSAGRSSLPDLWLEVWNGTNWSVVGNMKITGIGNDIVYVPKQNNVYTWWQSNPSTRNIRIMGRYFDANDTSYDEINYTDVWVAINYSNFYRAEIEHNATGVTWSGNLNSLNASINFTTNVTSMFNLTIYNFNSGDWNYSVCQRGTATANTRYNWWCNVTSNPSYYISDGTIRMRLNGTNHSGVALIREDYVQYYVNYTIPTTTYANISVEHNSSTILNPSSIAKINVTTLLKTNISSGISFGFYIYNSSSNAWGLCQPQTLIDTSYKKIECVVTANPSFYVVDGKIRVRLNSSGDTVTHQMMEDYLVYQITSLNTYRVEVWHNSSQIADGNISFINATVNFTTNVSDAYSLQIYDWLNSQWSSANCDSGNALAGTPTRWWCNETLNAMNYNSSDRKVRIRIDSTADTDNGLLKEDYVQYFVGYAK